MLFNSINFALFFAFVFLLYWLMRKRGVKLQNILLLAASYFFYAYWDWRFLFLLIISTLIGYVSGFQIYKSKSHNLRRLWLIIGVSISLVVLGFFKYYNFFIVSFQDLLYSLGLNAHLHTLQIILPIGISFYTFHGLSYIIDIYQKKREATNSCINYSLFVGFFPLLIAGPIERATHFLPQIEKERRFDYSQMVDGLRQILWGLFKKMVVADGCAEYANILFNDGDGQPGSAFVLGAIFFAFQIYGDFSGYSDMAIGSSRMLGFDLLQNFRDPYFSQNIADFWRRWHISLSTWFRDYLYIPLGGNKKGLMRTICNVLFVFLICGLWHGANWTFIVWGGLHGFYVSIYVVIKSIKKDKNLYKSYSTARNFVNILVVFMLTTFAWIFFRADSLSFAIEYISSIPQHFFTLPPISKEHLLSLFMIFFMLVVEWRGRLGKYALEGFSQVHNVVFRWGFYYLLVILIFLLAGNSDPFIYFQF